MLRQKFNAALCHIILSTCLHSVSKKYISIPSLSTEVITTYSRSHSAIASAVFSGSSGSGKGGRRAVLTEQNLQALVHVSPKTCNQKNFAHRANTPSVVRFLYQQQTVTHHDCCCSNIVWASIPAGSDIRATCLFTHLRALNTVSTAHSMHMAPVLYRRVHNNNGPFQLTLSCYAIGSTVLSEYMDSNTIISGLKQSYAEAC